MTAGGLNTLIHPKCPMDPKYTTDELRALAGQLHAPVHPFDLDRAAAMLRWAANVIDAANIALAPKPGVDQQ
jgi:hypothetical protein